LTFASAVVMSVSILDCSQDPFWGHTFDIKDPDLLNVMMHQLDRNDDVIIDCCIMSDENSIGTIHDINHIEVKDGDVICALNNFSLASIPSGIEYKLIIWNRIYVSLIDDFNHRHTSFKHTDREFTDSISKCLSDEKFCLDIELVDDSNINKWITNVL